MVATLKGVADSTRGLVVELNEKSESKQPEKDVPAQVAETPAKPSERLIGVWNGESTNESGETVGYAIRFDADGSIHWFFAKTGEEVVSADGEFKFDGESLKFNLDETEYNTQLKFVDDDNIVYVNENVTLKFSRYKVPGETTDRSVAGN